MRLDTRTMFFKAVDCYEKSRYEAALKLFQVTKNAERYRERSFYYIVRIYILFGYFDTARNMLRELDDKSAMQYSYVSAMLEGAEFNFEKALGLFQEYAQSGRRESEHANLNSARILMSMGEFTEASDIYRKLYTGTFDENIYKDSLIGLVTLSLYLRRFGKAKKYLELIKKSRLVPEEMYDRLNYNLLILEGKDPVSFNYKGSSLSHIRNVLLGNYDEVLLHIEDHKLSDVHSDGFFPDIDLDDLYFKIKELIVSSNGFINKHYISYRLVMDEDIGVVNGNTVRGVCADTFLGTDKIISFYPQEFSSEFDSEGLIKSPELKKKMIIKK